MYLSAFFFWLLSLIPSPALGFMLPQSGLSGITFNPYEPMCAHGCYRAFSTVRLSCYSDVDSSGYNSHLTTEDVPACRASSFPYLSSIAWCIDTECPPSTRAVTIEEFWEAEITGDASVKPLWSYGAVLRNITEAPTETLNGTFLNSTQLAPGDGTGIETRPLVLYYREQKLESIYGLSICVAAVALPILLTWLGYLPFMTGLLRRTKPWLYPGLVRNYHDRPLPFLLGNVPTVGQSFYIAAVVILNIVLLSVGYEFVLPDRKNDWFETRHQEILNGLFNRTGVLSFCLMPVLFLFSSRNNILLWLTNWSHSTYLLLHRWIARIFFVHLILHSIFALAMYVDRGTYPTTSIEDWWIWGIVATVVAVAIMLSSILYVRRRSYELFLITHIVLSVICLVGCWYHVVLRYGTKLGYETWLYMTFAVWGFDRLVRIARVLKSGIRRATVTDLGSEIVRVDVPGIRWAGEPGHHVHIYFPTLSPFRPWENHPFSTIPTAMLMGKEHGSRPCESSDVEKNAVSMGVTPDTREYSSSGMTLFIRKSTGITGSLSGQDRGLPTLLEGPYPNSPTKAVLESDRLLLLGGGIGITGLLPYLRHHSNTKLFFSVKAADECLVNSLPMLQELGEKDIRIGRRLNVGELIEHEANAGWSNIGIVVCGPAGMCDDARAAVAQIGKRSPRVSFELEVDAFSW